MAWTQTKPIAAGYRCKHCQVRYRQGTNGLCRTCARALGEDVMTNRDRERARVERQRAKLVLAPERQAIGPREIEAEGHLFEVVWDGTR